MMTPKMMTPPKMPPRMLILKTEDNHRAEYHDNLNETCSEVLGTELIDFTTISSFELEAWIIKAEDTFFGEDNSKYNECKDFEDYSDTKQKPTGRQPVIKYVKVFDDEEIIDISKIVFCNSNSNINSHSNSNSEEKLLLFEQTAVKFENMLVPMKNRRETSKKTIVYDFQEIKKNRRRQFLMYFHRHGMCYRTLSDVPVFQDTQDDNFKRITGDSFYTIPMHFLFNIIQCGFSFVKDVYKHNISDNQFYAKNVLPRKVWENGAICGFLTKICHKKNSCSSSSSCSSSDENYIFQDNLVISQELYIDKRFTEIAKQYNLITSRGKTAQFNSENYLRCGHILFGWPLYSSNMKIHKEAIAAVLTFYNLMFFKKYGFFKDEEIFRKLDCNWIKTIDYLFGPLQSQQPNKRKIGFDQNNIDCDNKKRKL
jgi:hypothetical protein